MVSAIICLTILLLVFWCSIVYIVFIEDSKYAWFVVPIFLMFVFSPIIFGWVESEREIKETNGYEYQTRITEYHVDTIKIITNGEEIETFYKVYYKK